MKSPEVLTAQLLVNQGYTFYPPLNANAPASRFTQFVNSFPDTPTNIVAVSSNTLNKSDGRLMDGTPINHPGLQVRVRSATMGDASDKIRAIWAYLNTVRRVSLALTETYRIDNLSVSGEPYFIGVGPDDQRPSFVFDLKITYRMIGE